MVTYKTSIAIAAEIDAVWHTLTEIMPSDPNPFGILRIEGKVGQDERIRLWSEVDPKRAFALRVTAFERPGKMVWEGGMPLGLFKGRRTFGLSFSDGHTRFEMQENFSGVLSGMIAKSIPDLTPSFEKFAQALKEKAERA